MQETTYAGGASKWRRTLVLLAAIAVSLVGIFLVAQRPLSAHDHQIPDTVLMKGAKELQAGILVNESSWDWRVGDDLCENVSTFYSTRFPETDSVAAGSKVRVRIFKSHRPDSFEIAAYRALDENGQPSGQGRLLNRSLERVVRDGKTVAWDAVFFVHRPDRDYYLISEGHWQDRHGCGADQYAYWSFHVKTR